MAELLVYAKNNWMDALTPAEVADRTATHPPFAMKYAARYQQGDIIEIRENGYFATHGFNRAAFVVIKVPDLDVDNSRIAGMYDGENLSHRRRFRIAKEDLPTAVKQQLVNTGEYTTTRAQLVAYYRDKAE